MSLNETMELLARQPLLGLIERDALRLLAFSVESRSLRAGDVLFRRGEGSDSAYLVVSGAIALVEQDDGRPASEVVGPGALLGELCLFAPLARPVTAMAREPAQVLKLRRSVMRRVLAEAPGSAEAMAEAIAVRLQEFAAELAGVQSALDAIDRE